MGTRLTSLIGWSIVITASLYFIFTNALHYFTYQANDYGPGFWPFAPWLLLHITAGMLALLLGPFQFIASLRKKYPGFHRTTGKIYLISVTVAAIASLYISVNKILLTEKAIAYGTGLFCLGLAWLLTSSMAYWSVRSRNYVQHREWMVRSFVVTTAFASFRLIDKLLTQQFHIDPAESGTLLAWGCWAFPLLVTEFILQGMKIRRGVIAMTNKGKI